MGRSYGRKIVRLRSAKGWGQSRLLRELTRFASTDNIATPVTLRTLQRWEHGQHMPRPEHQRLLEHVLGDGLYIEDDEDAG